MAGQNLHFEGTYVGVVFLPGAMNDDPDITYFIEPVRCILLLLTGCTRFAFWIESIELPEAVLAVESELR